MYLEVILEAKEPRTTRPDYNEYRAVAQGIKEALTDAAIQGLHLEASVHIREGEPITLDVIDKHYWPEDYSG